MLTLTWGERTHVGRVRQHNEDAMLASPPLFAVADGMGGHAGGEIASTLTVETLAALAAHENLTRTDVLDAVRAADATIAREATDETTGMGTTLCGLAVTSSSGADRLVVFNVGDSRAYRLRTGTLVQLTQDHSVVQELIDRGEISTEEAERHPDRNVITRSLGAGHLLDIDWWTLEPAVGDRYLLASDGLTKELEAPLIARILTDAVTPDEGARLLVDEALASGGRDNITVVVVEVTSIDDTAVVLIGSDPVDADTTPRATRSEGDPATDALDAIGIDADTNPRPGAEHRPPSHPTPGATT